MLFLYDVLCQRQHDECRRTAALITFVFGSRLRPLIPMHWFNQHANQDGRHVNLGCVTVDGLIMLIMTLLTSPVFYLTSVKDLKQIFRPQTHTWHISGKGELIDLPLQLAAACIVLSTYNFWAVMGLLYGFWYTGYSMESWSSNIYSVI